MTAPLTAGPAIARPPRPMLSVIVPAHQAASTLRLALDALAASDLPRELWELVVVDNVSTDDTAMIAAEFADTVVRLTGRLHGPAYSRNRGVEVARGDVVVFVDADVCVHEDTLRRFAVHFASSADVGAVFGSYDTRPPAPGLVSQYRNLLHHYVHHQSPGEAETFWAGCGAVRRDVFFAAGKFDEWTFPQPTIEDIELGYRVRSLGHRILLDPAIQGTHLKRWSFRNMVMTDLKGRGVPWMRLLLRRGAAMSEQSLNLRAVERINTLVTGMALVSFAVAALRLDATWLWLTALCVMVVLVNNRAQLAFFERERGVAFAVRVIPLVVIFYLVSGFSAVFGWLIHSAVGAPTPDAVDVAFAEVGHEAWPPVPSQRKPRGPGDAAVGA